MPDQRDERIAHIALRQPSLTHEGLESATPSDLVLSPGDGPLRERQALLAARDQALEALSWPEAWEPEDAACAAFARTLTARRVLIGLLRRPGEARIAIIHACARAFGVDHLLSPALLHRLLRRRTLAGLLRRSRTVGEAIVRDAIRQSLDGDRRRRLGDTQRAIMQAGNGEPEPDDDGRRCFAPPPIDRLRLVGWRTADRRLPPWLIARLAACFALGGLDEAAALDWVKQVVNGWRLPVSEEALLADATRIRGSGLFDAAYYAQRAGIACDENTAVLHYALIGDALGIAPSDRFDPAYYADRHPDVAAAGCGRLLHYSEVGRHEWRRPMPPDAFLTNRANFDAARDNVILVVHEASRTGAPILGWNIARHLAQRHNVFTVVLGDGPLIEAFAALSAEVHCPFPLHATAPIDLEYGLRRLLDRHDFKYAVVNGCGSWHLMEACFTRLIPTLLLMHEFGSYVYDRASLCQAFDMASEIVFPAQMVADSSLGVHPPLGARNLRIMPQGMSALPDAAAAPSIVPPPALQDIAAARAAGAFIVLGAGSVVFRKGIDLFLGTALATRREVAGRDVRFVWVGHGYQPREDMAYSIYLSEQLERSGLNDSVTFVGEMSDLEPVYALADVFLLSSRLDPLPNVSIDAAHRGIPIVCFKDASGTADILLSDPATAAGVVEHLDTAAAAGVILTLMRDRDARAGMAAATQRLARSVFDMAAYCDGLDRLGSEASKRFDQYRADADLLAGTDDFDRDLYCGPSPRFETRERTIRRIIARSQRFRETRRMAAGFDQDIWRRAHRAPSAGSGNALTEFIRAGRPAGPWLTPVLRSADHPAGLSGAGIKALLHVHLTQAHLVAPFLERLRVNRRRIDLLVSTDAAAMDAIIRDGLDLPASDTIFVVPADENAATPLDQLITALQADHWRPYQIVGHLHDGGADSGAATDSHWTSLLGGPETMLDRILAAFEQQPLLGLVSPVDPLLPTFGAGAERPPIGMFWARRSLLAAAASRACGASVERSLADACAAAGLDHAVAHAPGVFA